MAAPKVDVVIIQGSVSDGRPDLIRSLKRLDPEEYLTVEFLATLMDCDEKTVERWVAKGELPLPHRRLGKRRFRAGEILDHFRRLDERDSSEGRERDERAAAEQAAAEKRFRRQAAA